MKLATKGLCCVSLVTFRFALPLAADPAPQPAAPPVGVLRIDVPSNGYALVSMPFEPLAPGGVNALLGAQLTGAADTNAADTLLVWRPDLQAYATAWRSAETGDMATAHWVDSPGSSTPSSLTLGAGDAFWLRSRQTSDQRAFIAGRVPTAPDASRALVPGYNLVGYPFAASIALNATALQSSGGWATGEPEWIEHDRIQRWRNGGYGYYSLYDPLAGEWEGGWYGWDDWNTPTTHAFRLGEGFWYQRDGATNAFLWTEVRPYGGDFGGTNVLPRVVGVAVDPAACAAAISVAVAAPTNHPVDILTLDADPDGAFAVAGWTHAARLDSLGGTNLVWTDLPAAGRPGVTNVHARFYLAARGDADADGDGLADALETHVHGTNPSLEDSDDDDQPDGWELANAFDPLDPGSRSRLLRVDALLGDNLNDGYVAPVRNVGVGLGRAKTGDTVVVSAGEYDETSLSVPVGRTLRLRPLGQVRLR